MEQQQVLAELTTIFRDVFDNPSLEITPATTAMDIEEWDSLTHIQLVVAIEKHFKIKFTSAEINSFKNVGDMCEVVKRKVA